MVAGNTITTSLSDSLFEVAGAARSTREYTGRMSQLVRKETLGEGVGNTWNEVKFSKLTAMRVTETTKLDNPQQFADSLLSLTPTMVVIQTFVTDRVKLRINKKSLAQMGKLGQEAVMRLRDLDGLDVLATGNFGCSPGAGNVLTSGHIAAAKANITSNTTEPYAGSDVYCVLHGFQIKDIYDELVAGIGTYAIPEGATANVFKNGYNLPVAGVTVFEDGNIAIDSSDDAIGGVFARDAIICVQGRAPRVVSVRDEFTGGGGEHVLHYDEYVFGLGNSTTWIYYLISDATAPTS